MADPGRNKLVWGDLAIDIFDTNSVLTYTKVYCYQLTASYDDERDYTMCPNRRASRKREECVRVRGRVVD